MASVPRRPAQSLSDLDPGDWVRVVVLLDMEEGAEGEAGVRRRGSSNRGRARIREASGETLREIDGVLARFGGERLADTVSILGTMPLETTVEGARALMKLDHVKGIIQDQGISALTTV